MKVVAIAAVALFFFASESTIVSSVSIMTQVMPAARATFLGLNAAFLQLGRMFGDGTTNYFLTWGGKENNYTMVSMAAGACFVVAAFLMIFAQT